MVHRGELCQHPGARAHHRRLVRHLPGRLAPQLRRPQGARRQRSRTQWTASLHHHRRPRRRRPQHRHRRFRPRSRRIRRKRPHARRGTTTSSSASRTSSPPQARQHLRHGREQVARRRLPGPSSAPSPRAICSTPPARPTRPSGDGALDSRKRKLRASPTHFVYDPANPVPTVGGPLCCDPCTFPPARATRKKWKPARTCSSTPRRRSIRTSKSPAPSSLDLFAPSSAVDTDFTAKLVDVWPNGYAQNLTEGILRARYRESTTGQPNPSSPARSTNTRSTSGPPAMSSSKATASASKFPAATSRASTATSTPASPRRLTPHFVKATQHHLPRHRTPERIVFPIVPR